MIAKIPVILEAQPDGGYTATCPVLPELVTEGDSIREALLNVEDAFEAVREIYEDRGCPLPSGIGVDNPNEPLSIETIVVEPPEVM